MKRFTGMALIMSGILLTIVPRYVLPACEYEGFSRMHCTDTAHASMLTGVLLAITGILLLVLKSEKAGLAAASVAFCLSVVTYIVPDVFGYCLSSKMPCNFGMVPAIRFISIICGLSAAVFLTVTAQQIRKKGKT